MALPSTGAISFNNVNQELGRASPYNQQVALNDSVVRTLFQRTTAGSSIAMSDGRGKSNLTNGQVEWTTANTYSWTVPAGVTSICVVAIDAGNGGDAGNGSGGGNGGNLYYKNSISTTPGETLTVVVGAGGSGGVSYNPTGGQGGGSCIKRSTTNLCGRASINDQVYDYRGTGGTGAFYGGSGGAGGYSASGQSSTGGDGGGESSNGTSGTYGAGGGAGGGWDDGCWNRYNSGKGGDTYAYGRGDDGGSGQGGSENTHVEGYDGSDGSATNIAGSGTRGSAKGGSGGSYNGYDSGDCGTNVSYSNGSAGTAGVVRVIWSDGSTSRSFPSTNTKNL